MDCIFQTKSPEQHTYVIHNLEGFGQIPFQRGGVFITSNKELIKALLRCPAKRRGDYFLVTNAELVAKYLEGEDSDVLTEEILDSITRQGIMELGKVLNSTETQPILIKAELLGAPITTAVQRIIDFYKLDETKDEVKEKITRKSKAKKDEPQVLET